VVTIAAQAVANVARADRVVKVRLLVVVMKNYRTRMQVYAYNKPERISLVVVVRKTA